MKIQVMRHCTVKAVKGTANILAGANLLHSRNMDTRNTLEMIGAAVHSEIDSEEHIANTMDMLNLVHSGASEETSLLTQMIAMHNCAISRTPKRSPHSQFSKMCLETVQIQAKRRRLENRRNSRGGGR